MKISTLRNSEKDFQQFLNREENRKQVGGAHRCEPRMGLLLDKGGFMESEAGLGHLRWPEASPGGLVL